MTEGRRSGSPAAGEVALPVFLVDGHDVTCFSSVDELTGYIEPIDVENAEYVVYDSEGQRVALAVTASNEVSAVPTGEYAPDELASQLRYLVAHVGRERFVLRDDPAAAPLPELVRAVAAFLGREDRSVDRYWRWYFVLTVPAGALVGGIVNTLLNPETDITMRLVVNVVVLGLVFALAHPFAKRLSGRR